MRQPLEPLHPTCWPPFAGSAEINARAGGKDRWQSFVVHRRSKMIRHPDSPPAGGAAWGLLSTASRTPTHNRSLAVRLGRDQRRCLAPAQMAAQGMHRAPLTAHEARLLVGSGAPRRCTCETENLTKWPAQSRSNECELTSPKPLVPVAVATIPTAPEAVILLICGMQAFGTVSHLHKKHGRDAPALHAALTWTTQPSWPTLHLHMTHCGAGSQKIARQTEQTWPMGIGFLWQKHDARKSTPRG